MTQTTTYSPTLMQKLLGRNYKWWYIIKYNFNANQSGIVGHIFSLSSDIVQNLAVAYVWLINGSSNAIITYLVIGRIYKALSDSFFSDTLGNSITSGKIVNSLLVPISYIKLSLASNFGKRLVYNSIRAASFLIPVLILNKYITFFDLNILWILFLAIILSYFISFITEFIFGSIAFFVNDSRTWHSIARGYFGVLGVLSGLIVPLDKLPLSNFLQILPFGWILHHPMQIYLGKYSPLETLYVFLGGIVWCVVLYFLAKLVFKMGLKRNESVGL